mmetsp:Transcript_6190/g.12159  ORF Transcript_6190/g.12159 Transcript_6190/m.12159 type:complete len:101 (-) Transcript_6190:805-1107(-)|eukprot:CAMPEP_0184691088 /NCGR_PEP_ID=MMETSP0312-20130426/31617_1 /TAXON_ID=31354 /ORGANISM="Compsopogon coeruleus, Strain SAG 36.94" /LENGTH=100 /DNA_ID=CAMNT_0027148725 /DNA_START=414 /DNA_END=716 /DNA_ORIENTATION=-
MKVCDLNVGGGGNIGEGGNDGRQPPNREGRVVDENLTAAQRRARLRDRIRRASEELDRVESENERIRMETMTIQRQIMELLASRGLVPQRLSTDLNRPGP